LIGTVDVIDGKVTITGARFAGDRQVTLTTSAGDLVGTFDVIDGKVTIPFTAQTRAPLDRDSRTPCQRPRSDPRVPRSNVRPLQLHGGAMRVLLRMEVRGMTRLSPSRYQPCE
jgi:hypothetical protein